MYIVYEAASTFLFDHCLLRVVSEETKAVLTIKWNILLLKCHKSRNSQFASMGWACWIRFTTNSECKRWSGLFFMMLNSVFSYNLNFLLERCKLAKTLSFSLKRTSVSYSLFSHRLPVSAPWSLPCTSLRWPTSSKLVVSMCIFSVISYIRFDVTHVSILEK